MGRTHPPRIIFNVMLLALWLLCCCTKGLSFRCSELERQALLKFKNSLIDPSNRLSSWAGEDCCNWTGVGCNNQTGCVTLLDVRNPYQLNSTTVLVGQEVSPSLLDLKHLEYLDLSWNNFAGVPLPNFLGSFQELRHLSLSYSHFGGIVPHHLGNLSTLRSLDLTNFLYFENFRPSNPLSVDNLQWLSRLPYLEYLYMSGVDLSQASNSLQALGFLPHLQELDLSRCKINGSLSSIQFINFTSLVVLNLRFNEFQGPVPNSLGNLTSLRVLDLHYNRFNGTIQNDLSRLCNLETLDMSSNNLQGDILNLFGNSSSQCFKSNRLETLSLSSNQLSGYLPNWLSQLNNLEILSLDRNSFHGPIPPSLLKLSMLRILSLGENQLNGTIPESLGQLSQLESLLLPSNSFEGGLSEAHFSKLSNLKVLDLSSTSLILKVRSDFVPPFQLVEISLKSCKLGPKFPTWLRTQKVLTSFYMSNASIDSVPGWFFNLSSRGPYVVIDLSSNLIHGKVPKIIQSWDFQSISLDLSHNSFEGPFPEIPSNVHYIDLSHNLISEPISQKIDDMVPGLEVLILSNNFINGSIPNSFCKMNALRILDLSMNNLSGDLPGCWTNLQALGVLDLSYNNLSGIISSSVSNLLQLQSLHLNRNKFQGQIPLSLKICTSLVTLDLGENNLSGVIPTWIGENLSFLKILRLRMNRFKGVIPLQLCRLTGLQYLDLAQNNISGTIPNCFGNLSGMALDHSRTNWFKFAYDDRAMVTTKGMELEYTKTLTLVTSLDLSSNDLVGGIPEELTVLTGLRGLNLSKNQLGGGIPEKIGDMILLESLDLSENQFSGKIPQSMSALHFLGHLNLSHNKFSGKIPSGNQLQTLDDASIYSANPELCGAPLKKKCPGDEPSIPPANFNGQENDEDDDSEMKWFYIGMASGHTVGFWGVCCVLFFKKSWRLAYFRFLIGVKDWLLVMVAVKVG